MKTTEDFNLDGEHEFAFDERDRALAYLMRDGNLRVPCSRYGRDTAECAAFAWNAEAVIAELTGESITVRSLEYTMGLVVNDSDSIEYTLSRDGDDEAWLLLRGMGLGWTPEQCDLYNETGSVG